MSAVQFDDQNKPYVFKGDEKSPTKTEITTGIQDGTTVEITNGISLDETILVPRKSTAQTGFGPMGGSSRDGGSDQ
jgi:HlyD family secretion protein